MQVTDVALSPDGYFAIIASREEKIEVWNIRKGQVILNCPTNAPIICCDISLDLKTIVAGDALGAIHFLEWIGGGEIQAPEAVQGQQEVETRSGWLLRWLKGLLRQQGR